MSYADYTSNRPHIVTCRHCGWTGEAGGDCDCERMEEERIAARLELDLDERTAGVDQ